MDTGLRRLRYFHVLARELNFRRSADLLGLTQPALSRAIALLERDVGACLLLRSTREVTLTPAGASFALGCARVLAALDGAVAQARKAADGRAGSIVIGYTDNAISGRLPDIVQTFRSANPDIRIRLRQAYTQQQYDLLDDGQIDVGFLTGPISRRHCYSVAIQRDRFVVILPKRHPFAERSALSLGDLADSPFVLGDPERWVVYHEQLFRLCKAAGFSPQIVQTAPDLRGIVGLVSCGMGLSVQTTSLMGDGDQRVVFKDLLGCDEHLLTQAIWDTRNSHPVKSRFVEHVQGYALS